jgi:hypothetical protein
MFRIDNIFLNMWTKFQYSGFYFKEISDGLPIRHFKSFMDAANEAAREAIVNGQQMGKQVGETVLKKIIIKS